LLRLREKRRQAAAGDQHRCRHHSNFHFISLKGCGDRGSLCSSSASSTQDSDGSGRAVQNRWDDSWG
jgi:hypothetical protein